MERKSNRKILWLIAGLIGALALLLCGGILTSSADDAARVGTIEATETGAGSPSPGAVVGSAGAKAAQSVKPTRSPKPVPQISGDDIVHVGEDVPAGVYRAIDSISDDGPFSICYWLKSSDAEGSKIIDNGLPTGGRPQVTLKAGQWFSSQGCPDWRKQ
jgi:hypothetical protein